jgi:small-conductance mechanosensitive channel
VIDPVRTMGDALLHAIPGLVFIAILIVVARYVLRLVALFFGGIASRRIRFKDFAQEWAWPTYRLVRIVIVAFTIVIAYPYIPGSNSDAFKGVSIFLGLLMSLGAASVVANSLAGYTLIYRRAFQVGDRIQVAGLVGDVVEMRQQVTHLRTVKNEEVTIPSSMMLNSHVVNYSSLARTEGLVLHTTVGIGYETPWRQVEAMLQLAASRTPGLKPEPVPFVLVKSLGDFAVVYELNAYCGDARTIDATYASMHRNILDVFNEYDVAIMTPAYVSDPAEPKVVPRDRWFLPPAKTPT